MHACTVDSNTTEKKNNTAYFVQLYTTIKWNATYRYATAPFYRF